MLSQFYPKMRSWKWECNDVSLWQSITSFINISEIFLTIQKPLQISIKISSGFSKELYLVSSWINTIIDIDGIAKQKRFVVRDGVDPFLDESAFGSYNDKWSGFLEKTKYYGLPDLLTTLAEEELKVFSDNVRICGIVYLPQVYCSVLSLTN